MGPGDKVVFNCDFDVCKKGDTGEIIRASQDTVAGRTIQRLLISTPHGNVKLAYSNHAKRHIIKKAK